MGRQASGAGKVRVDLNDEQPIGIVSGRGAARRAVPPMCRARLTFALFVGRSRLRHHHPGREPGHDRPHLAEAARHELDPVAQGAQQPLRRAEEAAAVADPGLGEDVVEVQAQCAADLQVLPVVACPERRSGGRRGWPGRARSRSGRPGGATPTASSTLQTLGMAPLSHRITLADHGLRCRQPLWTAIHDFRLYPHRGCAPQNDWDTLLFPDNGAWRMAATPLGRHFPNSGVLSAIGPGQSPLGPDQRLVVHVGVARRGRSPAMWMRISRQTSAALPSGGAVADRHVRLVAVARRRMRRPSLAPVPPRSRCRSAGGATRGMLPRPLSVCSA